MQITNNYILVILFICILSIALGIITIMNIDKLFDGLILDSGNNILDFERYLDSAYGKVDFINYINSKIKNDGILQKNKKYNMANVNLVKTSDDGDGVLQYEEDKYIPILFKST